uniref:ATP synthase complex subunit 8 n=1 Tax=Gabala argentata TaxID=1486857 RepID=A0A0E3DB98_GABAR|nr:ATP synthase F0 subunit 8 [Gabala argentata]AHW98931.1 ATP synthase F0 subunit 8 [Gabala argentata]
MPQMMPINWMMSFIFFLIVFIIFNILNYYIYNIKSNNKNYISIDKKNKNFFWKW